MRKERKKRMTITLTIMRHFGAAGETSSQPASQQGRQSGRAKGGRMTSMSERVKERERERILTPKPDDDLLVVASLSLSFAHIFKAARARSIPQLVCVRVCEQQRFFPVDRHRRWDQTFLPLPHICMCVCVSDAAGAASAAKERKSE